MVSLLSEGKGSNNPPLFTAGTLNNASRCVWKPAEMRADFPAGSPNLFSLSFSLSALNLPLSPPLALSAECWHINLLSLECDAETWCAVVTGACQRAHSCTGCFHPSVIIHFNDRKHRGKIHHATGSPCKKPNQYRTQGVHASADCRGIDTKKCIETQREALCNYNSLLFH